MPGIFFKSTDRRSFLKTSLLGAAAVVAVGGQPASYGAEAGAGLRLALLSDTHVPGDQKNGHRGFNPWENLKRVVPEVVETRPEGVIINGDAARLEGLLADYQELKDLLQPIAALAPVYLGLGNHDDRANFNKIFANPNPLRADVMDKHVLVLDHEVVRVVILDSLLYVNKVAGLLGRAQRDWLGEYLAKNLEKPVVLFVHHTLEDGDGDLLDAGRLFEIIRPHRQVKAIFYGHSHGWSIKQRENVKVINLPAVGYNFRDEDPVGWIDARFQRDGVELTLRAFAGNQADDLKVTRVLWG